MKARPVNDVEFEAALGNPKVPFACAFMSRSSIPCDHFRHEWDGVAEELAYRVRCTSIDADEHPTLCQAMQVGVAPSVLLFFAGQELGRWEGPYSREAMAKRILEKLSEKPPV